MKSEQQKIWEAYSPAGGTASDLGTLERVPLSEVEELNGQPVDAVAVYYCAYSDRYLFILDDQFTNAHDVYLGGSIRRDEEFDDEIGPIFSGPRLGKAILATISARRG